MTYPRIAITPPGLEACDLSEHLAVIRRSKSTRGCEIRLTRRASGLWSFYPDHPGFNSAGVFQNAETLIWPCHGATARIQLAESPGGLWALGFGYSLPLSGAATPPSVWNRLAFETRADALSAGAHFLITRLHSHTARPCEGEPAATMIAVLREALTPQLELL